MAEETKVPLYSISACDIKMDPASVQKTLEDAFELAKAWNALILLDEADIFLEKRSIHDLERNRLVSGKNHNEINSSQRLERRY